MQKEKLGITGLYIHCICSTATAAGDRKTQNTKKCQAADVWRKTFEALTTYRYNFFTNVVMCR